MADGAGISELADATRAKLLKRELLGGELYCLFRLVK